jgi:hypothetical protein
MGSRSLPCFSGIIPDALFGFTGAKEAEGLILLVGFWAAAIYLGFLLMDEVGWLRPE